MRNYRLHRFDRYTTRNLQDASVQLLQYDEKFAGRKRPIITDFRL